jgi:hypothetical protein
LGEVVDRRTAENLRVDVNWGSHDIPASCVSLHGEVAPSMVREKDAMAGDGVCKGQVVNPNGFGTLTHGAEVCRADVWWWTRAAALTKSGNFRKGLKVVLAGKMLILVRGDLR